MLRPSPSGTSDAPTTSAGSEVGEPLDGGPVAVDAVEARRSAGPRRVVPTATNVSGRHERERHHDHAGDHLGRDRSGRSAGASRGAVSRTRDRPATARRRPGSPRPACRSRSDRTGRRTGPDGGRDQLHRAHRDRRTARHHGRTGVTERGRYGPATAPDRTRPPFAAGRLRRPGPPYHCPPARATAILAKRPGPSPAVEASCRAYRNAKGSAWHRPVDRIGGRALLFALALALPAIAAQGPTRLLDPSVSPGSGTTATTFTLSVTYRSQNDSPADFVKVKVGRQALHPEPRRRPPDWKKGVRFSWSGKLAGRDPHGQLPVAQQGQVRWPRWPAAPSCVDRPADPSRPRSPRPSRPRSRRPSRPPSPPRRRPGADAATRP